MCIYIIISIYIYNIGTGFKAAFKWYSKLAKARAHESTLYENKK